MQEEAIRTEYFTDGAAAYDIYSGSAAPQEIPYRQAEEERLARERQRQRDEAHANAVRYARAKQAVPLGAVVGYAVVAVALVLVLLSCVRLSVVTSEISALSSQYTELEAKNKSLSARYEKTFNLNEVKEYATGTLGMKQMLESNVTRYSMARADRGVVLARDDSTGLGLLSATREFIASLMAYLQK